MPDELVDGCLGHVHVKTRLTPTDRSASGGSACSADPWLACKSHGAKSGGDGCREGLDASLMDDEVPNARPTRMKGLFFLRLFFTLCAAEWLKIFSQGLNAPCKSRNKTLTLPLPASTLGSKWDPFTEAEECPKPLWRSGVLGHGSRFRPFLLIHAQLRPHLAKEKAQGAPTKHHSSSKNPFLCQGRGPFEPTR